MARQDIFRKELQCNLTDEELNVYRDELARLTTEEIEIEAAKKEAVSEFGAKLQKCVAARRLLATKISTKKEYRQVDVEWRKHFEQNCATLIRLDTYEVVDTRPLSAEERQQELDLQAAAESDPAEPFECKGCKTLKARKEACGVENCTA